MEYVVQTRLCDQQQEYVDRLITASIPHTGPRLNVLLIGPTGAGKRTIARGTSEQLGLDFVEVRCDAPFQQVSEQLFGTTDQSDRAMRDGTAPGDAGRSAPTLLYLAGIEQSDPSLSVAIHRLVTRRTYADARGYEWLLDDDVWLVGAFIFPMQNPKLHREHWVPRAFQWRIPVDPPRDTSDLADICSSMCAAHGVTLEHTALLDLAGARVATDNLHALHRWIELAALNAEENGQVAAASIRAAMVEDLNWVLSGLVFRGREITSNMVKAWVSQFPDDLQALAAHIVREIAEKYFVSMERYHGALTDLIKDSEVSPGTRVTFCRWQVIGDSAPRLAHTIKNQARWITSGEIDLGNPETWPSLPPARHHRFMLADDFVGSGRTVASLFDDPPYPLPLLLDRYSRSQVIILIVAGFEEGLRRIRAAARPYGSRVRVVPYILFRKEDCCLASESRIITDPALRDRLKAFCVETAKQQMPGLGNHMWLGYNDVGAIVVFYDSVPNNSLPLLWHDYGTWRALFPRTGLARE